jgi:hypothetical protein
VVSTFPFRKKVKDAVNHRRHKPLDLNEWLKIKKEVTGLEQKLNNDKDVDNQRRPQNGVTENLKAWFLYFDQNNMCKLVHKKVKTGHVDIEDKRFHIDISKPLLWERGLFLMPKRYEPLFIIKWNEIYPDKTVNPVDPMYMTDKTVDPELLKKTMSLKIIGNMLKSPKEVNWLLIAIFGVGLGAFIVYYLTAMKIIKV